LSSGDTNHKIVMEDSPPMGTSFPRRIRLIRTTMPIRTATLHSPTAPHVTFPCCPGRSGPDFVIGIRTSTGKSVKFTYDPAPRPPRRALGRSRYISTATKGELRYRGLPIEELAVGCTSSRSATCCCTAKLPGRGADAQSSRTIVTHSHDGQRADASFFMRGFRRDAHPNAVLTGMSGAMSAFYPDFDERARCQGARTSPRIG
jgi:citrate synthase